MADDETTTPDEAPPMTDAPPTADAAAEGQLDLSQIRVETLMLQVASELLSIGAGQLGMVPEMINGADAVQASLAITGADALIQAFLLVLPEGAPVPQPVEELRRAVAELQLAFLRDTLAHCARVRDVERVLCHAPDAAADWFAELDPAARCVPQGEGELVGVGGSSVNQDEAFAIAPKLCDVVEYGVCFEALGPTDFDDVNHEYSCWDGD